MLHYKTSVIIHRPVDQVFDYVTNIENSSQWGDAVVDAWQETDGPMGAGTIVTERVKMGPVTSDLSWEITAFEPNRLCVYEGESELGRSRTAYIFEALGDDTRLAVEVTVEQSGIYRFLKPFIQFSHKRNRLNSLKAIKAILEQT
jgi:uncharacterized protein YndB with AHSA1/START domain